MQIDWSELTLDDLRANRGGCATKLQKLTSFAEEWAWLQVAARTMRQSTEIGDRAPTVKSEWDAVTADELLGGELECVLWLRVHAPERARQLVEIAVMRRALRTRAVDALAEPYWPEH